MKPAILVYLVFCVLPACADFQYQSTTQITGGTLLAILRFTPGAGRLREPQVSTIAFQGNLMAHKGPGITQIIDLEKRTITRIDDEKRTFSVMTFDQLKQAIEDAAAKTQQAPESGSQTPAISMDAKIENTGNTRTIEGYETKESIFTMSMTASDPGTAQSGAMILKLDMWIAPEVAGYSEVRDFYKRLGREIDWIPSGSPLMSRPDIARAVSKLMVEGGSVDGTPIEDVMTIQPATNAASGTPRTPSSQTAPQIAPQTASDVLAGALGGRLGGLGGLGRKKQQQAPASETSAPANGSLLVMRMQNSNFSAVPVDSAIFRIPSGYRQVPPDLPRGTGR